jgi:hypothetical protein
LAAPTGAKACPLGLLRTRKENDPIAPGPPRWTRRATIDACGTHSSDKDSIEARVSIDNRLPAVYLLHNSLLNSFTQSSCLPFRTILEYHDKESYPNLALKSVL